MFNLKKFDMKMLKELKESELLLQKDNLCDEVLLEDINKEIKRGQKRRNARKINI